MVDKIASEIIYSVNDNTKTKNVDDVSIVNMTCLLNDKELVPALIQAKLDLMKSIENITTKYGKLMEIADLTELAMAMIHFSQIESDVADNLYVGYTAKDFLIKVQDL